MSDDLERMKEAVQTWRIDRALVHLVAWLQEIDKRIAKIERKLLD